MAPPVTAANQDLGGAPGHADDEATGVTGGMAEIGALIARGRRRLRAQGALEGATTASIVASASALTTVFAVRAEHLDPATGIALLVASAGVLGVGALIGALRRLDDEAVARRIDRASGLADRLSTAVAFAPVLARPPASRSTAGAAPTLESVLAEDDDDTRAMMRAAVKDAARAVPRADVVAATPVKRPRDLYAAVAFAGVAALAAGLGLEVPPKDPNLIGCEPGVGRAGAAVTLHGERLCGPKAAPDATCALDGAMVTFGGGPASGTGAVAASILRWTGESISVEVPGGAPIGPTEIVVWARGQRYGVLPFEVLSERDDRNFSSDTVALDEDDEAYMRDLVADLKSVAKRDGVDKLEEYAAKIEQLLDQADRGELTKEQMLAELKKAEDALAEHAEPQQAEVDKALAESGKELAKNPMTKELGQALQEQDLSKAKAELEKLAEKLADDQLTPKQQEELAKTLEKTAKQFEQKQAAEKKQQEEQSSKVEEEIKRLEKERDQAKTEEERQQAERRLEKKKQELESLEKKQAQKDQSAQRRSLERLHKDMDKAAKELQKKEPQPGQDPSQDGHEKAARSLKDAAEETGKVDGDKRRQAAEKKVASQMDDLREAMRRAKQRGQRGPKNPFGQQGQQGQQGKQQDFNKRAGGGKGQKGAWKPGQAQAGQGKQPGQPGNGQEPGQGKENGGQGGDDGDPSSSYGDEHDPNLVGDPTGKSGDTTDESLSGVHGKGPSRRETILAAAQKGFASTAYKQVFADYKDIVEEVMRSEKVPPSYKYYVKKYFTKIKPHAMD